MQRGRENSQQQTIERRERWRDETILSKSTCNKNRRKKKRQKYSMPRRNIGL